MGGSRPLHVQDHICPRLGPHFAQLKPLCVVEPKEEGPPVVRSGWGVQEACFYFSTQTCWGGVLVARPQGGLLRTMMYERTVLSRAEGAGYSNRIE